ncbi:TonB-dependent receptor [Caulobacter sp. Root487D2Y]|uniref:TonB-dependent receptor plug domain-containing protein n=1 Tax=Caulobacter sp. Root487D2Y TaxID=1736547 RepID=UPI0006F42793|nr:TonB-dependent receptor [Caulobacter sp. Root487D2Y]KQY29980.1 TonB-dependent receptor [Caulobacter sp. Root487D2Y]
MKTTISRQACVSHLAIIAAVWSTGTAVQAQTAPAAEPDTAVSEIVVTGTSIRGVASAGSPTIGIGIEELKASGASTASDAVRLLPQVVNLGADESRNSFSGGAQDAAANSTAVRAANLRGIGPEATLLLLNGRRLAPNGVIKALSDLDQIPTSSIARIEVVTDGASAIYGSDAVAGVVNLITRKDFDGAETTLRYDFADDVSQKQFSQTFGKTWDKGGFFFSYEHNERGHLSGADRDFASQNRTARGGSDARPFTAAPGNIVIGGVRYALPPGNGVGVPSSALVANTANRYDEAAAADLLPKQNRDTVLFNIHQHLDENLELWYEGFYTRRKYDLAAPPALFSLAVRNTNPWYVSPAGQTSETVEYRLNDDLDPNSTGFENAQQNAIGFNFDLPKQWRIAAYVDHSVSRGFQDRKNVLNNGALTAALASSNPATAFNPFGDGTFNRTNNAALLDIIDANRATWGTNIAKDFSIKADGPLFELPAGSVRVAIGAEYHDNGFKQTLEANNVLASGAATYKIVNNSRNIHTIFGELFVPLVSPANAIPGVNRLELSLAGRREDYSDFGETTNPKVGLIYAPVSDLSLRATYGTSFRAPSLVDSADQIKNIFIQNLTDPTSPSGVRRGIFTNGGNGQLGPETAKTWSAGLDWKPKALEGLSVSATWYKILYDNRIDVAPTTALTSGSVYAAYIVRRPAASDATATAAFNALVAQALASPDLQNPVEPVSNIDVLLDGRRQNLGQLDQRGLDVSIRYDFSTPIGDWAVGTEVAKILKLERKTAAASPWIDVLDTFGNPVDLRVRGTLSWRQNGWSANLFANYTDSYLNTAVTPNVKAKSQTTYDVTTSYAFGDEAGWGKGVRVSANVINLFDKDPPIVLNGTSSWDSQNASAMGRFVSLEITKAW